MEKGLLLIVIQKINRNSNIYVVKDGEKLEIGYFFGGNSQFGEWFDKSLIVNCQMENQYFVSSFFIVINICKK